MAWRVFALDALTDEPWRNGRGRTRTIVAQPRESGEPPWDWRISVATVEQNAPFSAFPGVDRTSLLLCAGQVELKAFGEPTVWLHRPGDVVAYRGDSPWQAVISRDGRPLSLLNVMTRRTVATARLQAVREDDCLSGHALCLLVVEGQWRVVDAKPQAHGRPDDTVVLSTGGGAMRDPTPARSISHCRIERLSNTGWLAAVSIDLG
ncbi:MAG: HutD family protein [Burkholderiales bacterium]